MKLKRVDEPVPSPDGKWVVFSATDVDLDANTKISHLWIVAATGGESGGRLLEKPFCPRTHQFPMIPWFGRRTQHPRGNHGGGIGARSSRHPADLDRSDLR